MRWPGLRSLFQSVLGPRRQDRDPIAEHHASKLESVDYDRAIAEYSEAIEINPTDDNAYVCRGNVRAMRGDTAAAMADFAKALELNPRNDSAYYNRGVAQQSAGNWDEAIVDCTRAIELYPERADAYYTRGNAWREKGEFDRAVADYGRAIELNPQDGVAYLNRGVARFALGDASGAIADYSQAIAINPQNDSAYYNRGVARLDVEDFDEAVADLSKAIESSPHDSNAYYYRGIARRHRGEIEAAWQDIEYASNLISLPEPPEGYSWERAPLIRAGFLRPDGWHFKQTEQSGQLAYFITKEPIPADAEEGTTQFETGFSINVWQQVSQVKGVRPSDFAQSYVAVIQQSTEHEVENVGTPSHGSMVGIGVQFRTKNDPDPLRQQLLLVANDATDTLYHIMFESPIRQWDEEWPVARMVLKQLVLHPEV